MLGLEYPIKRPDLVVKFEVPVARVEEDEDPIFHAAASRIARCVSRLLCDQGPQVAMAPWAICSNPAPSPQECEAGADMDVPRLILQTDLGNLHYGPCRGQPGVGCVMYLANACQTEHGYHVSGVSLVTGFDKDVRLYGYELLGATKMSWAYSGENPINIPKNRMFEFQVQFLVYGQDPQPGE